ncbi:hypothetical protein COX85_01880 [Candidatus Micrarchaeota archaeon CG_4_10_14_0_2_um_filter_55_9]|nr:MAG: hypothetical protein COX85_01880 [Candidatus Micrarchaeota archaeon CG_4_10_14_0_2_um_filter_55_9]
MKCIVAILLVFLALSIAGCIQQQAPSPTPVPTTTAFPTAEPTVSAPTATIIPPSPTPEASPAVNMPRGRADADFEVPVYDESKAQYGTTLFPDNHVAGKPRIVEVNMLGEILWEYALPPEFAPYTNPGFDVEPLSNGNVLFVLARKGVYEINRNGAVEWKYENPKVSHDADRLPNGNTLIDFGNNDAKSDVQAREIDANGNTVWSWQASSAFDKPPYAAVSIEGWTHANAVLRMDNGDTLVSLRNFNLTAEIAPDGTLVRTITNTEFDHQHDPVLLENGNILLANHGAHQGALELTLEGEIVWRFDVLDREAGPLRDANKLPNGNVLIIGSDRIIEVTPGKEIVWMLRLKTELDKQSAPALGFYKAERLAAE